MKLQWAGLLLRASLKGVNAMGTYMLEAMNSERVSGYGPVDEPSWVPTFFDESPPYKGHRISREDWTLTCSSEESDYSCQNAIDGSNTTSWRSGPIGDSKGHSITVDLRNHYSVSALVILPPIDTENDGLITHHEVWVSMDNKNWKGPIAYGMWPNSNRQRLSAFEPTSARYVKLTTNTEATESSWIGISELNLYATLYTIPRDPKNGLWGPTLDFPVVPVAGAQEASGHIVLWSSWASDQFHSTPGGQTAMARWNPFTNEVSKRIVTNTQHDMFCPGISIDGTGMMVVTGGNDASETSLYDAEMDEWIKGPEMHLRRGYQASTTLADGRIFVIGGSWAGGSNIAKDGEIYDPATRNWTMLPGAKVKPMLTDDMEGPWRADNHGWLFGWKKNSVFQAGPSKAMNWYYVEGEGSFKGAGKRLEDDDSMSGNAVMFDAVKGKILTIGGSPDYDKSWATSNAHVITLGEPGQKPDVQPAGQEGTMHYERVFHTSVVLPDGKVFIAGGQTFGIAFNEENVQFVPELYDPEKNTFTELSQNNVVRVYHTLSILLPDGRKGELRSRPEITTKLPDSIQIGRTLKFHTNRRIASASLVRLCSATHTVNTDQRRVPLDLRRRVPVFGRYSVTIPNDPGIVIPGYWMLFVMDETGTPSIAKTILITSNVKTIEASDETQCEHGFLSEHLPSWKLTLTAQIPRRG
ncbi:hypothetical protein SMACR_09672 [Sordaria macrospora]|uniref:WGS project CABT00000000 data, contig 2.115 n=2 Tax=Sordaria macrospora TaxID=5147 RepID=F7WCC9_SORMK|nr:uncharacterized protein SMAC_09672 [Sordaria macrospora k-hell]KAA8622051.1 hypothetical protein SMACR_09672 [Sordaria macrospora]KAH7631396.1 hypothetical protein B0T09DRAFT_261716 [Sordaria sp. MPI-SDFR-AT-0083]WPJ62730.1 hypothetical protein SMAC4_09672 [Sordaria macrospora]CCC14578.1 unnamed protein product [Sordaria macrospora k-hell]